MEGETIFLPSDDQAISIQMRGGPEANMVTGWAQILALEPGYSGVYHCIAENTQVRYKSVQQLEDNLSLEQNLSRQSFNSLSGSCH